MFADVVSSFLLSAGSGISQGAPVTSRPCGCLPPYPALACLLFAGCLQQHAHTYVALTRASREIPAPLNLTGFDSPSTDPLLRPPVTYACSVGESGGTHGDVR